jgi:hypothetical protein
MWSQQPFSLTSQTFGSWFRFITAAHFRVVRAVRHTKHVIWRILRTRELKEITPSTQLTNRRISTPRMSELLQLKQAFPLLA